MYRKTTRLATQPYAAACAASGGTEALIRARAVSEKPKVKTKNVRAKRVTGSLKMRAMIRGVSRALASCTATRRAEEAKTTNVNSEAATVPSTARAVSGSMLDSQHPPSSTT